jgi:hypothetical protein
MNMKKAILIGLIGIGLVATCFGKDHLEVGYFKNQRGQTFKALYVYVGDQCQEVHLFSPDGRDIGVGVEPGTSVKVMDSGLQRLINAQ